MGLHTTHGCFEAPYSSFTDFRYSLARQLGINLDDYNGYRGNGTKDLMTIDSLLLPLFIHSDCDGVLTPKESESIVLGLNNILENFNEDLKFEYGFKDLIIQFRDGCLDAYTNNEDVIFS